jgi:hypothetical protein
MDPVVDESRWVSFWHRPLRAERLALVRFALAFALFLEQLLCYWPHLAEFYGPEGVGYAGLHDAWTLSQWRWTTFFFFTDDPRTVEVLFLLWMAATCLLLLGWHARLMSVLVWLLTMSFLERTPIIKNCGDDVLSAALFLLIFLPSGRAFSLDRWLQKRRLARRGVPLPADWENPTIPAWGVRLLQIQLCVIYLTTGLAKLRGSINFDPPRFGGTWWEGTSVYYVLNDVTLNRMSWVELPLAWWFTYAITYVSVWFETLFPLLVLWPRTRKWTLWFGVVFHIGIYLLIEVGWFSFYTLSLYGAWIPGEFWNRHKPGAPAAGSPR